MGASPIFFSYSRTDGEQLALTLARDLQRSGMNIWIDQLNIPPGKPWDEAIANALKAADCVLMIATDKAITSPNVLDEISYALDEGKRVIPIKASNSPMPFRLKRLQFIDFTSDYQSAFNQLLQTLRESDNTQPALVPHKTNKAGKSNEENNRQPVTKEAANDKQPVNAGSSSMASKIIGISLILVAVLIAVLIKQITKAQYFIIYTLIGVGIALLLSKSAEKTTAKFGMHNISVALAGGVALPFILFFTNPIGSFKSDHQDVPATTSVTVFVHGKQGQQDMVLRQQGHVIMDVRGERKRSDINENGAAFFQNLAIGDKVRINVDFSEPYKSLYPDSNYTIPTDGRIYLPVALQGIDKVRGMVLYRDAPLEGVTVKIDTLVTTTNKEGSYYINIPEVMQRKEYNVQFIKEGFKTKTYTAYPQTQQPLDIVMERQDI